MNGLEIQQVFISGGLVGFIYQENEHSKEIMLCFLIIGVRIIWW